MHPAGELVCPLMAAPVARTLPLTGVRELSEELYKSPGC